MTAGTFLVGAAAPGAAARSCHLSRRASRRRRRRRRRLGRGRRLGTPPRHPASEINSEMTRRSEIGDRTPSHVHLLIGDFCLCRQVGPAVGIAAGLLVGKPLGTSISARFT